MMIEQFIDNVLIIDDKPNEVEKLVSTLEECDIRCSSYTPANIKGKRIKTKQIIFCDVFLSETDTTLQGNISELRSILKNICSTGFGSYGIVLWTSHLEDSIDEIKTKISEDKKNNRYTTPLFIVGLDKQKYIESGYTNILNDLNAVIEQNKAAYFFVNWMNTVKSARNKAISDIYSLVPDYDKQNTELMYILYKMALNHTGLPKSQIQNYDLTTDAYKAFDELLYSDLINQLSKNSTDIFKPTPQNPYADQKDKVNEIYSKLNSKLFIDTTNIKQDTIIPGNVYEIINPEMRPKLPEEKGDNKEKNKDINKYIAIELTPPCDFSQMKKINSRLIKGFLCDIQYATKFTKGYYYKDMFPLSVGDTNNLQFILDFRYLEAIEDSELIKEKNYKVLFRVTPKLFADILQKFSSYYGRLGLSNIKS
ncbi:hypothetical protein [Treponema phagedenis]|nr:hypothetical protein [Treponema phagedenis]